MTLGEVIRVYREKKLPSLKGHQAGYMLDAWERHTLAARRLDEIRGADIVAWIEQRSQDDVCEYLRDADGRVQLDDDGAPIFVPVRKIAPKTVYNEFLVLSAVFGWAREAYELTEFANPCNLVPKDKKPKGKPRDRRLREDEYERLMNAAEADDNLLMPLIVALAVETAMRRAEIAGLLKRDVALSRRVVKLRETKNGDDRRVPPSPLALEILKAAPTNDTLRVFDITADEISRAFARIRARREGLTFHDLRHEATSRLLEKGLNLREVAQTTGHKTLQMLMRYTHPRAEAIALKLEAALSAEPAGEAA